MDYELSLFELGNLLEEVNKHFNVSLLARTRLSGGWLTVMGEVEVESVPQSEGIKAGNNIIVLNIIQNGDINSIKLTGIKDNYFNVNIAPAKYKEIKKSGLSLDMIKEKEDKCTLKVDENMIFTIDAAAKDIQSIIKEKN